MVSSEQPEATAATQLVGHYDFDVAECAAFCISILHFSTMHESLRATQRHSQPRRLGLGDDRKLHPEAAKARKAKSKGKRAVGG